jgi:hypothetical protein
MRSTGKQAGGDISPGILRGPGQKRKQPEPTRAKLSNHYGWQKTQLEIH